ncbi:S41 family peptidase [Shewanella sp. A25]|nr:S41 family peptidase [Shewanella shenzhenensis]
MKFSYRAIVRILSIIIGASLLRLAFIATPENHPNELSTQDIRQDLYVLLQQLEQHSAFYALDSEHNIKQLNHLAGLISEQYQDITPKERFAAELTKLLNSIKDPGSLVSNFKGESTEIPFILRPLNAQWLALDKNNSPLSAEFPFITHIDGIPLNKWISTSQAYLSEPAKESQEMQAVWLRKLNLLREDLGLSIKPYVLLTLSNDDLQTTQMTMALAHKAPSMPKDEPEEIDISFNHLMKKLNTLAPVKNHLSGNGLETINRDTVKLKIDDLYGFELNKNLQQTLLQGMTYPLLIIDLREAKGFSPRLLTLLSRYQDIQPAEKTGLSPTAEIMGFARYRRSTEFRNDYLQPLNFRPLDALKLSSLRRQQLTNTLPEGDNRSFSPWYVRTKPDVAPEGTNRLAILVSAQCRQECEWIAYRTKNWSRVNLIGEKTSGDFARQYRLTLPNSGLEVLFSSSLTYDAKGNLLSGKGTEPDIYLPQNSDIEWQGLVSLVKTAAPKPIQPRVQPKFAFVD